MIASTIHFDDCADRKRGVRVVPGSHKRAVYGARDGGRHLPVEQYPVSEGAPCPAAAGVVLYFSYLTTPMDRASIPATSRAPRCGADCATPTIVRSAWIISRGQGMLLRGINPEANAASGVPSESRFEHRMAAQTAEALRRSPGRRADPENE